MTDALNEYRARWDPVLLLHTIREAQSALVAATSPEVRETRRQVKASTGSSPSYPVCGGRGRSDLLTRPACEIPGTGGPETIPSRVFGVTCWVVAGRAGCYWQGADGKVAIGTPGPVHRGTVENHAAQSERVARHHGQ